MRLLFLMFLLLATHTAQAQAPQTRVWLTVNDHDTLDAQIGVEYQVDVHLDTRGEQISGLQLFWTFPAGIIEPVRWETSPGNLGWIQSNALFPYSILFSGHHLDRPLNEHMSGERLDWIAQTGTSQNGQRPSYSAVGILCSFHFRVTGAVDGHELGFDHINSFFRNSLYWRGSEDAELSFNQERPLVLNVLGITLDELPDVYLTGTHSVDSLNLYDYLEQSSSIDRGDVEFLLGPLGNGVCNLDTVRTDDAFWLIASDNGGPGEFVSLPVTASFAASTSTRTYRVFKGEPPRISDTLRSTDPFVRFFEDGTFLLPFDDYVQDPNNDVSTLDWTITEISPALGLVINPVSHVGTFTALADWFGTGYVTVRVEDSIGMADVAVIQVLVLPVNDPPVLDFGEARLPVTPDHGLQIDLEDVTSDVDNTWTELFWSSTSDTSLVALRFDTSARMLNIVVRPETPLFTPVDFLVRVDDLDGGFSTDTLRVLVNSHPPVWQPVDDVVFLGSQSVTRNLNDYVSDVDNPDEQLVLTARGRCASRVGISEQTHVATFRSLSPSWRGVERVILTATDTDGNQAEDTLRAVSLLGNFPTVGDFDPLLLWPSQVHGPIILDDHVWDLDTPDAGMTWTIGHNQVFGIAQDTGARTVMVSAPPVAGRFDWITWQATDPELHSGSQTTVAVVIDTTGLPTVIPFRELVLGTFASDSTILLDEHVHDVGPPGSQMTWTFEPHSHLVPDMLAGHRLRITSGSVTGRDTLRLSVRDLLGNVATGFVPVRVIEGTPPIVSEFPPWYIIAGRTGTLDQLSSYVYDQDEGDRITWSFVPETANPLILSWEATSDQLVIQTDPGHFGVDGFLALAEDLSQNADSARLEIHSLENTPPGIELGLLANGANPDLLDLVAIADERLSLPPAGLVGDLALPFTGLNPGSGSRFVYKADLDLADGAHRVLVLSRDIVGNESLDSLDVNIGSLQDGGGVPSGDGRLWVGGSAGRWAVCDRPGGGGLAGAVVSRWCCGPAGRIRPGGHAAREADRRRLAGRTRRARWCPAGGHLPDLGRVPACGRRGVAGGFRVAPARSEPLQPVDAPAPGPAGGQPPAPGCIRHAGPPGEGARRRHAARGQPCHRLGWHQRGRPPRGQRCLRGPAGWPARRGAPETAAGEVSMKRITLSALLLLTGCGITGGDEDTGEGVLAGAWTQYHRGNYETALAAFIELQAEGSLLAEASEGQGWCQLMLGQPTPAAAAFRQSLMADEDRNSARAGEAFARRDSAPPDYPRAISQGRETLRRQPAFRFGHDTRIDWRDVHLLMAQAFFYQQVLDSSLEHCRRIDSGLALSATDTLSWGTADSFELALFQTLQQLGDATAP